MISSHVTRRQRASFTLVELLVAMALVIFIMVILTEAFTTGMNGFRQMKAIGDMNERLRACTITLRGDLLQLHFDGTKRLSDGGITTAYVVVPDNHDACQPLQGYVRIEQEQSLFLPPPSPPGVPNELVDGDGIPSFRGNSKLFMTVVHTGITRDDYFTARLRPIQYTTTTPVNFPSCPGETLLNTLGPVDYRTNGTIINVWAEVGYFLVPTGDDANGTPLFSLNRRVRVLVPPPGDPAQPDPLDPNLSTSLNWVGATVANPGNRVPSNLYPFYSDVSCQPDTANPPFLYFNRPQDLSGAGSTPQVAPVRGFFPTVGALPSPTGTLANTIISPQPLGGVPGATVQESLPESRGDDILLSDVISFTVRVLPQQAPLGTAFAPQFQTLPVSLAPTSSIFDTNISVVGVGPAFTPPPYRIRALEITIRIWDVKSQQSRQVSVIQDM